MAPKPVGHFLTPLVTIHIGPGRKRLLSDLVYHGANGTRYVVPAGFASDGASVPRFLWALYPPFGEAYEPATWLHDYLYQHAEDFYGTDHGHLARAEADGLMDEASEACGFRGTGRTTMHAGVRLGGWRIWRRHRKAHRPHDVLGIGA